LPSPIAWNRVLAWSFGSLLLASCSDSNPAPAPSPVVNPPAKTPTALARGEAVPGILVEIRQVTGGSGPAGSFLAGDAVRIAYTVRKKDGTPWNLDDFAGGSVLLSGPTDNYQRVLPEQQDLAARSAFEADGSYSYSFAAPIPAAYAPPLNDSASFTDRDGELAGQPLRDGTYTVGLMVHWDYTVEGQPYRDAGAATADVLFGSASALAPREVVKADNCNQCHQSLRAHDGMRADVRTCLLCHTSGAEDRNDSDVLGGTPGLTVDFRVLIHRIHNGAHLPSVLGVSTDGDGIRTYQEPRKPYQLVGAGKRVHDFSRSSFPVWPNGLVAMPRDEGYSLLSASEKATDDALRTGMASCHVCHGDPDGTGPRTAPRDGGFAYTRPTRRACGSCHDDVVWSRPYVANLQAMDEQPDDAECARCHRSGGLLETEKLHVHPLQDAAFNPGVKVSIESLRESGVHDNDGTIDPGEGVAVTLAVTDDRGAPLAPSALASLNGVLGGPTTNQNLVLNATIPTAALTGAPPFRLELPQVVYLEAAGDSTARTGDEFRTARAPHWDLAGALTTVYRVSRSGGGNSTLAAPTSPAQNWIDVLDATGFGRNDFLVLEDADVAGVEYLQIQRVAGNRLWFSSPYTTAYVPGPRYRHAAGAGASEVTLTALRNGTDYSLARESGVITELIEFGAGTPVVITYTTHFVMPATYPLALNSTPDLDESSGKWSGRPVVDGTYAFTAWGSRNLSLSLYGETNSYRSTSAGARKEFLVGAAGSLRPYGMISSGQSCSACHQDISFHGGSRRGFETCLACHGTAGAEDRPQYVAPNAPPSLGVTVDFKSMLHKIHMGSDLANASAYQIVGFGSAPWPNNFGIASYEAVEFPLQPGGVLQCTSCHGTSNTSWLEPLDRTHPTAPGRPTQAWRIACGSCHDSDAATSHIAAQTSGSGHESCAICHATDRKWHVRLLHQPR
jgi:hypothetical protein